MKTIVLTISFLAIISVINAQEPPKIIPPSPTAMQIQKYGDYPVGHYTGVPEISIPLFTIQQGDITLPISLSYHASGIKVTDKNGFVGIGWVLQAGGMISRTITGPADEEIVMPSYIKSANELNPVHPSADYSFLAGTVLGNENPEFDIFSYSFGSRNGKFVLKNDASKTPVLFPYAPLKITKQISSNSINFFEVVDETGTRFRFGKSLAGTVQAYEDASGGGRTGWMVTDIVSPTDSSSSVRFTYSGFGETSVRRYDQYILDDYYTNSDFEDEWCLTKYGGDNYNISYTGNTYATFVPAEISFKNGKVKFFPNTGTGMLDKMEIRDANNNLIRYIKFVIIDAPGVSLRKLLSAVQFYDKQNQLINQYTFQYNGGDIPDESGPGGNGKDFWGYYNGADNNVSLIPTWIVQLITPANVLSVNVGNANRSANENVMKGLVLERITYPTGGSTFFDFESNKYSATITSGPGLRIKRIINYDANGAQVELKTYKYGENESGYGKMDIEPSIDAFSYMLFGVGIDPSDGLIKGTFRKRIFSSEPIIDIAPNGSPVVYPEVTEYFGDEFNNNGKVKYTYDYVPKYWLYDPEYEKMHFSFLKDWNHGQLRGKYTYKNKGVPNQPDYELVHSTYNDYEENIRESIRGLLCYRHKIYQCGVQDETYYDAFYNGDVFMYADYNIVTGEKKLKSFSETDHTSTGTFSTTTEYIYNNNVHIQPTKKITTSSKGETISIEYKYPHDFAAQQPYTDMVNTRHIWSPVIEQSTYKNTSQFLQSTATKYNFWTGNAWGSAGLILPQTVETKTLNNQPETRMRYNSYNAIGNITTVSKESDAKRSYVWGYNNTYPIAEVINAASDEIAYSVTFESPWSSPMGSTLAVEPDAPLNRPCMDMTPQIGVMETESLNLSSNKEYVITYWEKGCELTIGSGTLLSNKILQTKGNWNLREIRFTGISGNVMLLFDAVGFIQELRLYPADAQMTTYAYEPLIGMTSQCDGINRITYYEYDAFGRLKFIRDENKNILKQFDYKYQQAINQ